MSSPASRYLPFSNAMTHTENILYAVRLLLRVIAPFFLFLTVTARAAGPGEGVISSGVRSALVQVEAQLQTSDGDHPVAAGWTRRCPKCGEHHVNELDDVLEEERPVAAGGYLVGADEVLAADPMLHPRFVRGWRVRFGEDIVPARLSAWAVDRNAALLRLERPLAAGRPLDFAANAEGPYWTLTYSREGNGWSSLVQPLGGSWIVDAAGISRRTAPAGSLALAADGTPVAAIFTDTLPPDASWRGSPAGWPWIGAEDYARRIERVEQTADAVVLHATLRLRPVPVQPGEQDHYRDDDDDSRATTLQASALVLSPTRVLVLRGLDANATARLEDVALRLPDGSVRRATFVASVRDHAGVVVEPLEPLAQAAPTAEVDWEAQRERMLLAARIEISGDERRAWFSHVRCAAVAPGFRGQPVPTFGEDAEDLFVFDLDGRLVGAPLARRAKPGADRWSLPDPVTVNAAGLMAYAGVVSDWADTRNAPRSAEEERKLVWLGVELQALDRVLAEAHGVSAQTSSGDTGALVSHVYADSPAERAGIAPGDVLLRMLPEGVQSPIPIKADAYAFSERPFPWDRYDEIPDAYFDRIPLPWMPAETTLEKTLKALGVGTVYVLDYARGGKVASATLSVQHGPVHYGAAAEYLSEGHGLRLRELTFETRRYFQIAEGMPGLLVARVDAGGAAAVAGLKPYEIVVSVNDRPVATVAEFEAALTGAGGEPARIGVRRMSQSRLVTLAVAPSGP